MAGRRSVRTRRRSRRRAATFAGACLSLALTLSAGSAGAQSPIPDNASASAGGPIPLFPPPAPPGATGETHSAPEAPVAERPSARSVEVQPLTAPAPDAAGLLTPDNGGFPADLWAGSPADRVAQLMTQLAPDTGSPAAQALAWRLLATGAKPPAGADAGASLLALRAQKLYAAGHIEAAAGLIERAGAAGRGPDFAALRADIALLGRDEAGACAIAESMRKQSGDAFWLKLSAFCAARAGDSAAMQLDLDLLSDSHAVEPDFAALLARIPPAKPAGKPNPQGKPGKEARLAAAKPVTPLLYALDRAAGLAMPADDLTGVPAPILRSMATDPQMEPARRLDAATAAASAGALPIAALSDQYRAFSFGPDQLANPIETARKLPAGEAAALLFQASEKAADARIKRPLIGAALTRARANGDFLLAARLYAAPLADLPAQADDPSFAAFAAEALLAADRADAALPWFLALKGAATPGAPESLAALHELWPVLAIAVPAGRFPVEAKDTADWADRGSAKTATGDLRRLALLDGLGRPAPGPAWWALRKGAVADDASGASLPVRRLALESARRKRLGEAILAALVVLGPDGARTAPPEQVSDAVAALRAAGLDAEARGIARDAALAYER